ncbi:Uncharacterised protein [Neisseria meningitidis]|nr:Uncharacterised protein [Neisseria meningitidis]CWM25050.1 Uncharacterised protein [Neisseria meningitidis]CWM72268.1 Uncharacterised protein [Neisseria meningitidis]CWM75987.1 Uncharacterised protein [Neisseria meningitidis]CWM85757.1 Uncharacterised protein [Neisseria meningitidis]
MGAMCCQGKVVNGGSIDGKCRCRIAFRFVDGSIGSRVDNGVGLETFDHVADGIGIGNV